MSADWGSATDSTGSRISLLQDNSTTSLLSQTSSRSSSSSQNGCNDSSSSSRQPSAPLPQISPLLNVSHPGAAHTSMKRALNISTATVTSLEAQYFTQSTSITGTSGSSATSPTAMTPGFSEFPSAPQSAGAYSPRDETASVLDPCLSSASTYARDRPTFSRPSSFSLPRTDIPPLRYPSIVSERMPSYTGSANGSQTASPPTMSDRAYPSYLRRGDDLRRTHSYGNTSSSGGSLDSESLGPFTPREEDPSWSRKYQLGQDPYASSSLGKRSRVESEAGYQYPPPPPSPEESRYENRYPEESAPYTYGGERAEYRPRNGYTYPPPPPPYRETSNYGPGPPPAAHGASAYPPITTSSRYSPIRTAPRRSSTLRTPISREAQPHRTDTRASTGPATTTTGAQKKFPCRFAHTHPIFCQQTFTTSGHASRHAKIHKEEKGIECVYPACGKRFTRADNMKQHLETHFRVRGRGKGKSGKGEKKDGEDNIDRAEMQRLLRDGAEKREREKGERERRPRREDEMSMSMSVSPRTLRMGERQAQAETPYYKPSPMDGLDALATVAVGRK